MAFFALGTFTMQAQTAALTADQTVISCNGDSTNIYLAITGGTAPYGYLWSNSQSGTGAMDTLYSMPAGTYSVTITDANGSTASSSITITEPTAISTSITVNQGLTCNYDLGAATVEATGGTPSPTNYIVDTNNAYDPDNSQVGTLVNLGDDAVSAALPIGFSFDFFGNTYSEFYISSNGFVSFSNQGSGCCTGQTLPNTTTPNNLIALAWEDLDPNNGNDGSISYYTIGTSPNQVLIVNFDSIPHFPGNVPERVWIQLKLFQTTNCIEIHTDRMIPDATTDQTQGIENSDGTIAYWYPGRNGDPNWEGYHDFISFCPDPYSAYLWSSNEASPEAVELAAGMNYVTVTDGNGCTAVDSVQLTPASDLVANPVKADISCYSNMDGSINSGISGGVMPYVYAWSNNATTSNISNLGPGSYTVSVEDALNCTLDLAPITIIEPDLLIVAANSVAHVECPGDANGSGSVVALGGVPPYTYLWIPGNYTTNAKTGLTDGFYSIEVRDSNDCFSYTTLGVFALNDAPGVDLGPDILNTAGSPVTLSSQYNAAGYQWSSGETTATIDVTATGTYSLEVSNAAGCTSSDTIYVEIWPTGIDQLNDGSQIKLFPNPATTAINIDVPAELSSFDVIIMDIEGSIVSQTSYVNGGLKTIDIANIASGVYSVSIVSDGARVMNARLVKSE